MHATPAFPTLTRRGFLLAGAGLVVAAACGGDDDEVGAGGSSSSSATTAPDSALIPFFDPNRGAKAGTAQRLSFGIADAEKIPLLDTPPSLTFQFLRDDKEVGDPIRSDRHAQDLPRAYYPVTMTFDEAGVYDVVTEVDGKQQRGALNVVTADQYKVPGSGDQLIPVATPTTSDPHGVKPICTAEPACPLHDVTLEQAMADGKPIAFLISTPKFCQVKICGPVLDVLLGEREAFADRVHMLHAEVYVDPENDPQLENTTEVVKTYQLFSEPVLWIAGGDNVITTRMDMIYDSTELRTELEKVAS
jgi:hypothetical protein